MMKNLKRFSAITCIGLFVLLLNSCEDDSEQFTVSSSPSAAVLAEVGFTDLTLDPVNTNNPAVTLNWNEANYGLQTSTNYNVEFASENTFANPSVATTVTGRTSVTLSMAEVNTAAGNAGLNPFEWNPVFIRVVANIGTQNGEPVASNVISINVYPYFNYTFDDYFLVGNGVAPGWDNNNENAPNQNPPLFRDENDENVYYFTGLIRNDDGDYNNGRFKVLETKGMWQPQWGDSRNEGSDDPATSGDIAGNPGTQGSDPGRFGVSSTGYYTFTINFATQKYTLVPFDATGITSPASLTLRGSSTSDVMMSQLAFDNHLWYANGVRLTPGDVQFVTDGGASWGNTSSFSGVATNGGGSIPVVVEDDYDVWFNDLTGRYILIPLNL